MSAPLPSLLTLREVCSMLHVTRVSIWSWRRAGKFPNPVMLSPTCPRWRQTDIERWLRAREAA